MKACMGVSRIHYWWSEKIWASIQVGVSIAVFWIKKAQWKEGGKISIFCPPFTLLCLGLMSCRTGSNRAALSGWTQDSVPSQRFSLDLLEHDSQFCGANGSWAHSWFPVKPSSLFTFRGCDCWGGLYLPSAPPNDPNHMSVVSLCTVTVCVFVSLSLWVSAASTKTGSVQQYGAGFLFFFLMDNPTPTAQFYALYVGCDVWLIWFQVLLKDLWKALTSY